MLKFLCKATLSVICSIIISASFLPANALAEKSEDYFEIMPLCFEIPKEEKHYHRL